VRIAVLSHTVAGRGGIERVVEVQAEGLRGCGHEVRVLSGIGLGRGRKARALAAGTAALLPPAVLRRYDVLLAHYFPMPWVAARSGVPYVHYLHHPFRLVHPSRREGAVARSGPARRLLEPLRRADARGVSSAVTVAVPSPSVAEEARHFLGVEPLLLPLGVDTAVFRPDGRTREGVLFVGRLDEPYKHLDWALEVARRLGQPLRVVGEGRPPAVPPGADVTFAGYLTGAPLVDAYRSSQVLIFPSVQEDFGLVPLEAMACGLPVVAWDDGHGPSLTLAGGSGGVLVQPYDLEAMARAVGEVLHDRRRAAELSERAPRWVGDRFSLSGHVAALERLLVSCASRPPGPASAAAPRQAGTVPGAPRPTGRPSTSA
jgi:glycosyltransferase involved in cell wall biosynthesis